MFAAFRALCIGLLITSSATMAQDKTAATPTKYEKASDIPVEEFFRRARYGRVDISPDGTKLATVVSREGRENLAVINLATGQAAQITNSAKNDVADFQWISNNRLFLRVADLAEASGSVILRGTYAVDADGQALRDLSLPFDRGAGRATVGAANRFAGRNSIRILSRTIEDSDEVIAEIFGRSNDYPDVYRYNTRTGTHTLLTFETPGNISRWVLDRDLVPRIAVRLEARTAPDKPRRQTMWHRDSATSPWQQIANASTDDGPGTLSPIAFDYDNKTLYVSSNIGQDKRAIYKYDIAAKKLGERIAHHPMIDLSGGLIFSREKRALLGISYSADRPATVWIDDDFAALQASIDATLPNKVNTINPASDASKFVLIHSFSATDPGVYYLYNREKKSLTEVVKSRAWIPPDLIGERRYIKYKARDGLEIPAWVTTPKGSNGKNLPLVVHIHGGPQVRGYHGAQWGRWPTAQFLASRGYAVLEPEPRGSTGFGVQHYVKSFKQWGLAMQDDITDGAMYLVSEGTVDKSKMCLFGGSYGGYATLQGLVKDPDLWRCGSAFVAVTDLELMQTVSWSDIARNTDYLETDFKRRVGDKDADREQFTKTSPAKNADKIKAAVMLTMGSDDQRVPLIHGTTMRDALEKAGKKVDYKVYAEAHGFNKDENVFDFYKRLEKFLAEHLR